MMCDSIEAWLRGERPRYIANPEVLGRSAPSPPPWRIPATP